LFLHELWEWLGPKNEFSYTIEKQGIRDLGTEGGFPDLWLAVQYDARGKGFTGGFDFGEVNGHDIARWLVA